MSKQRYFSAREKEGDDRKHHFLIEFMEIDTEEQAVRGRYTVTSKRDIFGHRQNEKIVDYGLGLFHYSRYDLKELKRKPKAAEIFSRLI